MALPFPHRVRDNVSIVKKTEAKGVWEWISGTFFREFKDMNEVLENRI